MLRPLPRSTRERDRKEFALKTEGPPAQLCTRAEKHPPSCPGGCAESLNVLDEERLSHRGDGTADLGGLHAFGAGLELVLDGFVFRQRAKPIAFNDGMMDENVLPVARGDESETL